MSKKKNSDEPEPTPEEFLAQALQISGNNLHLQVVEVLESAGWIVELSAYYTDDLTDKPREIDIYARKKIDVLSHFGDPVGSFSVYLFAECKYFSSEIAFRVQPAKKNREAIVLVGMRGFNEQLERFYTSHHYMTIRKVGKLYDAYDAAGAQPKTRASVFDGLTQSVKSLLSFRDKGLSMGVCYPAVIYSGIDGLYELEGSDIDLAGKTKETLSAFELNYAYRSSATNALLSDYFIIDFLHQSKLNDYLTILERDSQALAGCLTWELSRRNRQ